MWSRLAYTRAALALGLGLGACASDVTVVLPPPPAPVAPESVELEPEWYAHAVPSRPACVQLDEPTAAGCVAAWMGAEPSACATSPQTGDVACGDERVLQREWDGSLTVFVGDAYQGELEPGVAEGVWSWRAANGHSGACDLLAQTLCIYGTPERVR